MEIGYFEGKGSAEYVWERKFRDDLSDFAVAKLARRPGEILIQNLQYMLR
jgi:hypothetical protein